MLLRQALERREVDAAGREVVSLGDQRLLELLGIDIGAVNVKGKNALKEATVFACIRVRSSGVAKLPLKVYQDDGTAIRKATDHYLYPMLKLRPNPYMTMATFLRTIEVQSCLYGNAYILPEFGKAGRVTGLYPIDAANVQVWVDNVGLLGSKNRMWYILNVAGEQRKLAADEIIHIKGLTTDGLVGIAPLDYLKYLVENGASATRFINQFYRQGLQTKGVVQYVGDLDEPAKKRFREKFEEMSSGLKNAHRIALMPIGYQFQPISLTMADAQFLENTELTIRQIANAFGIKMHQLNDMSRATHTNIEEQQREFYAETLQDILTEYEQELTYKLLLDSEIKQGFYLKFNVDAILRADIKTRFEAYRIGVQGTFMTPNQVRALEEWPAEDGGSKLLVNGNMRPIDQVGTVQNRDHWTLNEKRIADGKPPLPGGDAVYLPATTIPAVEADPDQDDDTEGSADDTDASEDSAGTGGGMGGMSG
jgi:HK97 family phage portal protein